MSEIEVYHSFDEVPLDEPSVEDGDDSLHAHDVGAGAAVLLAPKPRPTLGPPVEIRRMIVPHPRDLKRGMKGHDVLALQRALSVAGFHSWKLRTGAFGAQLEKDLKRFQTAKKLKADGVYGSVTHATLVSSHGKKGQPAYDAYGIQLLLTMETPIQQAQRYFLAGAMALYNMRARVHYTQGWSRMWIVKHQLRTVALVSGQKAIYEDCSSSVTGLYYVAKCPDPNGFHFNGLGYTGTLGVMGRRHTTGLPPIGALSMYGSYYPWKHTTGVVSRGSGGVRVFSFGSENGPYVLPIDYRGDRAQTRTYPGMHY